MNKIILLYVAKDLTVRIPLVRIVAILIKYLANNNNAQRA